MGKLFFAVLCLVVLGQSAAHAQDGTLRPAYCNNVTRASLLVHGHPRPPYPILMASLNTTYPNARWKLVAVGDLFGIQSHFAQHGTVAMTVTGGGGAGTTVIASPWTGGGAQLFQAANVVGRLWNFTWLGTGMVLQTPGLRCNRSTSVVLGPANDGVSWIWNDP